ncbi:MAG: type III secretion inner membrane ring lipoprotein SctJ [Pseudomonadota bacterium]
MRKSFAVLAVGLSLMLAGCDQQVYSGLNSKDANEMVALLYRNGINASREAGTDGTYSMSVPGGDFARSVEILNRYGYPRENYKSIAEVFKGDGLIISPFEQRARLTYAMSQELERTISSIDGVVSCRVHVVLPELDMRSGNNSKASSSVMVTHRPSIDTTALSEKIRLLVANAVQDMDYRNVSIAFFPSDGTISGSLAGDGAASSSDDGITQAIENFDIGRLMSASPSTTFFLWIMAAAAGIFSLIIFLRRLQSRT